MIQIGRIMVPPRGADMATVTLKNVPEELVRKLEREARNNGRTLNQEVLARLQTSLMSPRRSAGVTVKALRRLHQRLAGLPPLTDSFLRRARHEGSR